MVAINKAKSLVVIERITPKKIDRAVIARRMVTDFKERLEHLEEIKGVIPKGKYERFKDNYAQELQELCENPNTRRFLNVTDILKPHQQAFVPPTEVIKSVVEQQVPANIKAVEGLQGNSFDELA